MLAKTTSIPHQPEQQTGVAWRTLVAASVATLIVAANLLSPPPQASAEPQEINWHLDHGGDQAQQSEYDRVVEELGRTAVAAGFSDLRQTGTAESATRISNFPHVRITSQTGRVVRMIVNPQNLYIEGFYVEVPAGSDHAGTHLVETFGSAIPLPAALALPFRSSYDQLRRNAAVESMHDVRISIAQLSFAIDNISREYEMYGPQNVNTRTSAARVLLYTALMLGEGTRFRPSVGASISHEIGIGGEYHLTPQDEELITSWGQMSLWGIREAQEPTQPGFYIGPNAGYITSNAVLATFLWVLLRPMQGCAVDADDSSSCIPDTL